jgi:hypothetical protein
MSRLTNMHRLISRCLLARKTLPLARAKKLADFRFVQGADPWVGPAGVDDEWPVPR